MNILQTLYNAHAITSSMEVVDIQSVISLTEEIPALAILGKTDAGVLCLRAIANKWSFQDKMMGEQYISLSVKSEKPIDWKVGDYCVFRGETYTLNNIPQVTQNARSRETLNAYEYDSIKFDGRYEELTRVTMLDITSTTGRYSPALGTNYTGSSRFVLFCGETSVNGKTLTAVCALAAKMQANLDRFFPSMWNIYVDTETTIEVASGETQLATHTEDKTLTFDNTSVYNALSEVHNTFDLDYSIKGRNIYIGYTLKNLTSDDDSGTFAFGYGEGYPTRENPGSALFQIKKTTSGEQKIVTRLRAFGSTKNMPYRYYNKKYNLSQSLFPANLQLPNTFDVPSVKDAANAERDAIYGINPLTNLPYVRHVKGESNDAYIDKNDDAGNCAEGIREDSARWDGSNGELKEIFPTIEGAIYEELRAALVEDQDGTTGANAFPNYGNKERIDSLLAIGHYSDGVLADDANIGNGILTDEDAPVYGITKSAVISGQHYTLRDIPEKEVWYGDGQTLLSVKDVLPGKYLLVPTSVDYVSVVYSFLAYTDFDVNVGFRMQIVQTDKNTGEQTIIATYDSDFTSAKREDQWKEVALPELPDYKEQEEQKTESITVTKFSDISVIFSPKMEIEEYPSGFSGTILFDYEVGKSSKEGAPESEYIWRELRDSTTQSTPFHVFIKDMGFDLKACFNGETPVVSMKSGRCTGREFEIGTNVEKVEYNGKKGYMLELNRAKDESLNTYYPSSVDPIEAGDYFVLLNIEMPEAYIQMAEIRLLKAATDYLADNCETKFTYQPVLSDNYLQYNYENMRKEGKVEDSIFWRLYSGLKITFRGIPSTDDSPLPLVDITIEQVSIEMGENLTPKTTLKLNDDIQQTTLQRLTISVDRIYNGSLFGSGGGGGGQNSAALLSILDSEGGKRFLSKKHNDEAKGLITFRQGANFGDFKSGSRGGNVNGDGDAEFNDIVARNAFRTHDFIPGIVGVGGKIDGQGRGELRSLRLWEWLEVPELRYNKVSIYTGIRWDTFGGGIIETITPDTTGAEIGSGTLKLDEGEIGAIAVGDLCMGIWHDESGNADANSDDNKGNFSFAGFKTVYFQITGVSGAHNENFTYVLRSKADGGNGHHPFVGMHFAGRGNISNTERQAFTYTTTEYSVSLTGVSTWEFQPANYYEIHGHLEGFSMPAIDSQGQPYTKVFHGYGQVFGNAYIFGQIDQFERLAYRCYVDQSLGGSIAPGETEEVTVYVINGYGEDVTSQFTHISVTRNTGDAASDALWNNEHTSVENPFNISFSDLGIDGISKIAATFTVTASNDVSGLAAKSATAKYFS